MYKKQRFSHLKAKKHFYKNEENIRKNIYIKTQAHGFHQVWEKMALTTRCFMSDLSIFCCFFLFLSSLFVFLYLFSKFLWIYTLSICTFEGSDLKLSRIDGVGFNKLMFHPDPFLICWTYIKTFDLTKLTELFVEYLFIFTLLSYVTVHVQNKAQILSRLTLFLQVFKQNIHLFMKVRVYNQTSFKNHII